MKRITQILFLAPLLFLGSCGEPPKMKANIKFKTEAASELIAPKFKNAHYWSSDMKWGDVKIHFTNIDGDYHDQSGTLDEGIYRVTIRLQGEGTSLEPGEYPAATEMFQEGKCAQIFITTSEESKPKYMQNGASGSVNVESIDGASIKGKIDITDGDGAQVVGEFIALGEDI